MGLLGLLVLCALTLPAATPEEHRAVIRKTIQLMEKADENWAKFHFLRRREVREMDPNGKVKSKESTTVRRETHSGIGLNRMVARNDLPLSAAEQAVEDEAIRARVAEIKMRVAGVGPGKPSPKKDREDAKLLREFPEAFDYKLVGTEPRGGRHAQVFEFTPRPGYSPKSIKHKVFEKLRGRCWVDKASGELIHVDAEVFDNVSVGFGLVGKIAKGTEFHMGRKEAAPGLWLVESQHMKFDARVMMVKSFRQEIDIRFSEFQSLQLTP